MDNPTVHICERCREVVEPDDPGVVRAVEQKDVSGFGKREVIDGLGVYFHEGCFPHGDPGYRLDR
jgi:hypothetical protein